LASLGVLLAPLWPFFGFPWPPKGKGKGIAKQGKAKQGKEMQDKTRQGKTKKGTEERYTCQLEATDAEIN